MELIEKNRAPLVLLGKPVLPLGVGPITVDALP